MSMDPTRLSRPGVPYDMSKDLLAQMPAYTTGSMSSFPIQTRAGYDGSGIDRAWPAGIHFEALSGVDLTAMIVVPRPTKDDLFAAGLGTDLYDSVPVKVFAELQTLSISSSRSVSAVRRLGENHVTQYTRGGRTIAGTMVFTAFNRDVFAEFYKISPEDGLGSSPVMHVDQIPEFNVVIQGMNEYGALATCGLIGVTLTNFGTTLSVHDLMIESTYTYVARHFYPLVSNLSDFKRMMALDARKTATAALSAARAAAHKAALSGPRVFPDSDLPDPALYGFDMYLGPARFSSPGPGW